MTALREASKRATGARLCSAQRNQPQHVDHSKSAKHKFVAAAAGSADGTQPRSVKASNSFPLLAETLNQGETTR